MRRSRSLFLKVPGVPPNTGRKLRESLEEVRRYGIRKGRECLIVLNLASGTRLFPPIEGERHNVELPPECHRLMTRYPVNSLVLIHNHHANVSFSGADLHKFLSIGSIYASVVVCTDGTTYYAARRKDRSACDGPSSHFLGPKTPKSASCVPSYDVERILSDYHWNHVCLTARYGREIAAGVISKKEALYNHGHENLVRLARRHGFRYGRVGGPPNHPLVDLRCLGEWGSGY